MEKSPRYPGLSPPDSYREDRNLDTFPPALGSCFYHPTDPPTRHRNPDSPTARGLKRIHFAAVGIPCKCLDPAGCADRAGNVGVGKVDPFSGELVQVWRFYYLITFTAHQTIGLIVGEDKYEIGSGLILGLSIEFSCRGDGYYGNTCYPSP